MTDDQAEKIANVLIGAAVAGAVYYVLKTPELRRMAWQLTRGALTGQMPAWFSDELRRAWADSAPAAADVIAERRVIMDV